MSITFDDGPLSLKAGNTVDFHITHATADLLENLSLNAQIDFATYEPLDINNILPALLPFSNVPTPGTFLVAYLSEVLLPPYDPYAGKTLLLRLTVGSNTPAGVYQLIATSHTDEPANVGDYIPTFVATSSTTITILPTLPVTITVTPGQGVNPGTISGSNMYLGRGRCVNSHIVITGNDDVDGELLLSLPAGLTCSPPSPLSWVAGEFTHEFDIVFCVDDDAPLGIQTLTLDVYEDGDLAESKDLDVEISIFVPNDGNPIVPTYDDDDLTIPVTPTFTDEGCS